MEGIRGPRAGTANNRAPTPASGGVIVKFPFMKFFPRDWMGDDRLRLCSLPARGLWIDMLCLMHSAPRRGYLQTATGSPLPLEQLARSTGCSTEEVTRLVSELKAAGVPDCTEHGVIYSRRMVREESKREKCSQAGKQGGGNPKLKQKGVDGWYGQKGFIYAMSRDQDAAIKIGGSVDPQRRATQGGAGTIPQAGVKVLRTWAVSKMGAAESLLHDRFAGKQESGEWFWLNDEDLDSIAAILHEAGLTLIGQPKGGDKGSPKRNPNPQSLRDPEAQIKTKYPPNPPQPGGMIPSVLDTPKFREAWGEWIAERKAMKRRAYSMNGEAKQLADLAEFGPEEAIRAIRDSIKQGWQGLFPKAASERINRGFQTVADIAESSLMDCFPGASNEPDGPRIVQSEPAAIAGIRPGMDPPAATPVAG
jgi:hypothetical protein